MPITDPKCPNCNAQLPLPPGAKMLVCQYCGNQVMLNVQQPQRPAPQPTPQVVVRMPRGARPVRVSPLVIILPIIGVLVGVGVAVYFAVSGVKKATKHARRSQQLTAEKIRKQVTRDLPKVARIHAYWGEPNLMRTARINDDEVDDILLLGRYHQSKQPTLMYVTAFDGATFKRIYRAGPFGDTQNNKAGGRTKLAVAGRHVVVTDYKATARVLDLGTGKELRAVGLTDRAEFVCADPGDPDQVWIEMTDKQHVAMNTATAVLTPAKKRPWWCPKWSDRVDCREIGGNHVCRRHRRSRVRFNGMSRSTEFVQNGHVIVLGTRHPGTRRPMAAARDAKTGKPKWVRDLVPDVTASVEERAPEHASVAADRLVLVYKLGRENQRLMALDANTGEPQWKVVLPMTGGLIKSDVDAVVASPTRVFAVSRGIIMVFDAATGKLLGEASESR